MDVDWCLTCSKQLPPGRSSPSLPYCSAACLHADTQLPPPPPSHARPHPRPRGIRTPRSRSLSPCSPPAAGAHPPSSSSSSWRGRDRQGILSWASSVPLSASSSPPSASAHPTTTTLDFPSTTRRRPSYYTAVAPLPPGPRRVPGGPASPGLSQSLPQELSPQSLGFGLGLKGIDGDAPSIETGTAGADFEFESSGEMGAVESHTTPERDEYDDEYDDEDVDDVPSELEVDSAAAFRKPFAPVPLPPPPRVLHRASDLLPTFPVSRAPVATSADPEQGAIRTLVRGVASLVGRWTPGPVLSAAASLLPPTGLPQQRSSPSPPTRKTRAASDIPRTAPASTFRIPLPNLPTEMPSASPIRIAPTPSAGAGASATGSPRAQGLWDTHIDVSPLPSPRGRGRRASSPTRRLPFWREDGLRKGGKTSMHMVDEEAVGSDMSAGEGDDDEEELAEEGEGRGRRGREDREDELDRRGRGMERKGSRRESWGQAQPERETFRAGSPFR